ncbi:MAG: putative glycoside hydrolase [bacterium]|nr:putative glycoside hydrolase [bacterium]
MRFIGILVLLGLLLPHQLFALPDIKPTFPRLANYFLHWTISSQEAEELSKFDLVILDAEVQERSRAELITLRRLNPDIILLAYVPASEVRRDVGNLASIAPLRYALGASIPEDWYLKDAQGNRRSFWPGTWIVNVASPWADHLAEFVESRILSTGLWDGVFYDNAWDDIVHFARGVPDVDRNGFKDDPAVSRRLWQNGLRELYRKTAARAPDKFVFENDGPMYAPQVHGVLLESFPRKGWARHIEELKRVRQGAKNPAVAILNGNTFNTGKQEDFKAMRFGFTTALLYDSFFSFDFGDQDHGQTWLYDEYGVFLGEPLGLPKLQSLALYRRDFEQGIVFVNTGDTSAQLRLPVEVEKIRGVQDPFLNNAAVTRDLTVAGKDGLIVLRPLKIILGVPFENGVFARVLDSSGQTTRAGFFAFDRTTRSGVTIAIADLDGDGKLEKITNGDSGEVVVRFGDGRRNSFSPFGASWSGDISFAVGDVTGDGTKELVVGQGKGGGQIRIYQANGTLHTLPFFPFGSGYRGGVNLAVGDLNKDGFSEIVVGAGPGGGPQVRIFSGEGRLLSGGFFAYDPRFRGGVNVAVGDVDQDGDAEIVTGPGVGGGPQVRIFDGKGNAVGAFFAFDRAARQGVIPLVTDVDGDGTLEIVAVAKEVL